MGDLALLIKDYQSSSYPAQATLQRNKIELVQTVEGALQKAVESFEKTQVELISQKMNSNFLQNYADQMFGGARKSATRTAWHSMQVCITL